MKKLLRFIIIFTVLFNIYSCETDDDCNGCEKWLCEKDTDCKENEICNYYSMCELNPCLSMNCGEGICELDELSTAYCKCNEGFYLKDKYKITETCIAMPECHSSEECRIRDNNGVVLHSCITGNICSGLCNNDNDCIGENEYCLINETERICYPISECVESQYFSFATYICESKGCDNSSSECPEGFVCENRECVKTCSSDEDCLNYKWANGDICNSQTLTCGNVQISNLTPKETAEILFKEIGSEESCVDSNEYFYESCNGFEIEYSNMNDLGTERIEIVDTTNNLTEKTIETQSEYDNLLNSAKEKTLLFLTTEFPSQTFKLVKSEVVYWDEPCSVGDLCDSIVIVYERTLGGIPLLGYEAYFQFDLNSNYRMISLGYLYITERIVDTALINELENDTVLIQNCDERIRYVSYGYYKINNEFEIVFLFTVQNGIYMISKNEFNSCQAVIDKIDDPYTNHACEAMPCYDPHEDCIPYEESDYYCDCEEGYEYNDDNVCVVSVK